ncbi:hypothetical protein SAMN04488136_116106 [Vibrio xiamenensis]|uniref:Uncharacterized protein n=1 Tax=Vibrio xiamenensis TaxID=861298 RepID=A0A1G8CK73_9VIBR|nr:hypothetical protein SAMN04488136_116106 [Vibrio xiamenensis]
MKMEINLNISMYGLPDIKCVLADDTVDYFDELTTLQFSAIAANALIACKDSFSARLRVKRANDNYKLTLNCAIQKNKIYIN